LNAPIRGRRQRLKHNRAAQRPAASRNAGACYRASDLGEIMIAIGIILLIIGFLTGIAIVWTIGIIVLVLGLIALLLGTMGHAIGGRRHYW
jgi:4-hydroxybenzoate polyprenyltransferase